VKQFDGQQTSALEEFIHDAGGQLVPDGKRLALAAGQ
jgi:hypothetical protein